MSFFIDDELFQFKVKGEKHSNSKVKTLPKVDDVLIQKKQDLATKVTPVFRLEQMYDLANDVINGGVGDVKNIPMFLKMVKEDIVKEDSDLIMEQGLTIQDIMKFVTQISRTYFMDRLNQEM